MRFIGNKTSLLSNIQQVIDENCDGNEKVFCDLFSGTSSVARYFKNKYKIISNDMLFFSYVLQRATIMNNEIPKFTKVKEKLDIDNIFEFVDNLIIVSDTIINGNKYDVFPCDIINNPITLTLRDKILENKNIDIGKVDSVNELIKAIYREIR